MTTAQIPAHDKSCEWAGRRNPALNYCYRSVRKYARKAAKFDEIGSFAVTKLIIKTSWRRGGIRTPDTAFDRITV